MRKSFVAFIMCCLVAAGIVAGTAGSARADIITPLPIKGMYQMVVDSVHDHVFLSDRNTASIVVTDFSGQVVGTVHDLDSVTSLALSPDDTVLYAGLVSSQSVIAIDTTTLARTATYTLPSKESPYDVAVQSGKLWVSYADSGAGHGAIGDFDLSASPPAFETQAAMGGWVGAPRLAADPSGSGVLVAWQGEFTPVPIATFNVSAEPATLLAHSDELADCMNAKISDVAVTPGGTQFLAACANGDGRFSTQTLAQLGQYDTAIFPNAVAVSADGTVAVGVMGRGSTSPPASGPDVSIYAQDSTTPLASYDLWTSGQTLAGKGLAWSPDGSRLFAISYGATTATGLPFSFHVFYPPLAQSQLTVSGPAHSPIGTAIPITGKITLASGEAVGTVTITRTTSGGSGGKNFTVPVSSTGTFTLRDAPPALGSYTYVASWAGTDKIAPASDTYRVLVTKIPAAIALKGPAGSHITERVRLTGQLHLTGIKIPAGTTIVVRRTQAGGGNTRKMTAHVAADGSFTISDTPPALGNFAYAASYAGTALTSSASATHRLTVTRIPPALRMSTGGVVLTGSTIHATAYLGVTYRNRAVSIYAQPFGGKKVLLRTGRVNSAGKLAASYRAVHNTRFTAVFSGDARYRPGSVSHVADVRTRIAQSQSGSYASITVNHVTYRLYHRHKLLYVHSAVTPGKAGRCVVFEYQLHYRGRWQDFKSGCMRLNKSSKITVAFNLSVASLNTPYRIRTDYGGDATNLGNDSSWQYFMVEP